MRYIALLRGINVGGANKVSMVDLKAAFESAGMSAVRTYINSGNVVFSADTSDRAQLTRLLQETISERLGAHVDMLLRDADQIREIVEALPAHWRNDDSQKCDVVFLWDEVDGRTPVSMLRPHPKRPSRTSPR